MDIPRLKIDLEGVRSSISVMLVDKNEQINKMVIESINRQITDDWIQSEIDYSVKQALIKSINSIADNFELREAITRLVAKSIAEMIDGVK